MLHGNGGWQRAFPFHRKSEHFSPVPARENGNTVHIVGTPLDREIIEACRATNRHPKFTKDFPAGITYYQIEELKEAIAGADFGLYLMFTPVLFSDSEFLLGLLPNLGLGILFIALGASTSISNNFKAAKNNEELKIEKIDL